MSPGHLLPFLFLEEFMKKRIVKRRPRRRKLSLRDTKQLSADRIVRRRDRDKRSRKELTKLAEVITFLGDSGKTHIVNPLYVNSYPNRTKWNRKVKWPGKTQILSKNAAYGTTYVEVLCNRWSDDGRHHVRKDLNPSDASCPECRRLFNIMTNN